jgi:hypothetical protein
MADPRVPGRFTVAVVATVFFGLAAAAAMSLALMLPDFLHARITGLLIGFALAYVSPRAFPFWREHLSVKERKSLIGGAGVGALLGFSLATLASFVMLSPNLSAPIQSPGAMTFIASSVLVAGVAGAYWAASELLVFSRHSFRNESIW